MKGEGTSGKKGGNCLEATISVFLKRGSYSTNPKGREERQRRRGEQRGYLNKEKYEVKKKLGGLERTNLGREIFRAVENTHRPEVPRKDPVEGHVRVLHSQTLERRGGGGGGSTIIYRGQKSLRVRVIRGS